MEPVRMTSEQYEELCRRFIAEKTERSVDEIRSVLIPNSRRPRLPEYRHQIDLYWETGDDIALYLNIANAKWRASAKVEQGEVLLLQQVRQKVGAHKAFMLTNVGFTAGAIAAARDDGIALHTVVPTFDFAALPRSDRQAIQGSLNAIATQTQAPIFSHRVENRGMDFTGVETDRVTGQARTPSLAPTAYETKVTAPSRTSSLHGGTNRSMGPGETRGGGNLGGKPGTGRGFFRK